MRHSVCSMYKHQPLLDGGHDGRQNRKLGWRALFYRFEHSASLNFAKWDEIFPGRLVYFALSSSSKVSEDLSARRAKHYTLSCLLIDGTIHIPPTIISISSAAWRSIFPRPRWHRGPIFGICICPVLICKSSAASSFRIRIVTGFDYRKPKDTHRLISMLID